MTNTSRTRKVGVNQKQLGCGSRFERQHIPAGIQLTHPHTSDRNGGFFVKQHRGEKLDFRRSKTCSEHQQKLVAIHVNLEGKNQLLGYFQVFDATYGNGQLFDQKAQFLCQNECFVIYPKSVFNSPRNNSSWRTCIYLSPICVQMPGTCKLLGLTPWSPDL